MVLPSAAMGSPNTLFTCARVPKLSWMVCSKFKLPILSLLHFGLFRCKFPVQLYLCMQLQGRRLPSCLPHQLPRCLAGLTLLLYNCVSRFPFLNYDDNWYIVQNPHIRTGLTWVHAPSLAAAIRQHKHSPRRTNFPLRWPTHRMPLTTSCLRSPESKSEP